MDRRTLSGLVGLRELAAKARECELGQLGGRTVYAVDGPYDARDEATLEDAETYYSEEMRLAPT